MDFCFVTVEEINFDDNTFEIRRFAEPIRLHESLVRFGILDPPWLYARSSKHIIVDGFKRLRWVMENGREGAFCLIFPEDFDLRELWTRRIEKRIFEREIDPAEKAQILSILAGIFEQEEIPRFFLSSLGVANRSDVLHKWNMLTAGGTELLETLASGFIAERAALETADWDKGSRDKVLHVIRTLKCSASIQVEIVERIHEIAVREEKSCADIIEERGMREILKSNALNHRQKTQALRELLAELRHPRLSSRLKQFRHEIEAIGLPSGVKITQPVAFEGNNWKMELSFTKPEELRKVFDAAKPFIESDCLDNIFRRRA